MNCSHTHTCTYAIKCYDKVNAIHIKIYARVYCYIMVNVWIFFKHLNADFHSSTLTPYFHSTTTSKTCASINWTVVFCLFSPFQNIYCQFIDFFRFILVCVDVMLEIIRCEKCSICRNVINPLVSKIICTRTD